jgi:hypothetical protein
LYTIKRHAISFEQKIFTIDGSTPEMRNNHVQFPQQCIYNVRDLFLVGTFTDYVPKVFLVLFQWNREAVHFERGIQWAVDLWAKKQTAGFGRVEFYIIFGSE